MGYYTKYDLNFERKDRGIMLGDEEDWVRHEIKDNLAKICPNYFEGVDYESLFDDEMKWYSYREDMIALSKLMPDYVFILSGEGEDRDDLWIKYFCDGQIEECYAQIIIPEPTYIFNSLPPAKNRPLEKDEVCE